MFKKKSSFSNNRLKTASNNNTIDDLLNVWSWRVAFEQTKEKGFSVFLKNRIDQFVTLYGVDYVFYKEGVTIGTLLHLAADNNAIVIAYYLVEYKNAKLAVNYPVTALYSAIHSLSYECAFYLLNQDKTSAADKKIFDCAKLAYDLSFQADFMLEKQDALVKQLLLYGANPTEGFLCHLEKMQTFQQEILTENPALCLYDNRIKQKSEVILTIITQQLTSENLHTLSLYEAIDIPFIVDDYQLTNIIMQLEKKQDSVAYLACGLLLDGHIDNDLPQIYENDSDWTTKGCLYYAEKRIHDAIDFYLKALTFDNRLKIVIDNLLDQLKEIDLPSVQKRLSTYSPSLYFLSKSLLFNKKISIAANNDIMSCTKKTC